MTSPPELKLGPPPVDITDIRDVLPSVEVISSPQVRSSSMATYFKCQRRFLLEYRCGIVPRLSGSALVKGTLVHLGAAYLYSGKPMEEALTAIRQRESEHARQVSSWVEAKKLTTEEADRVLDRLEDDTVMALAMVKALYQISPISMQEFEVVGTEVEATFNILGSRLDLLLRSREADPIYGCPALWVFDFKTTDDPEKYKRVASYAMQPRLYRWTGGSLSPSEPVAGCVYVCLQKPSIKRKEWQSRDDYLREIEDWYACRDDSVGVILPDGTPETFKSGPRKGMPKPRWEHSKNASLFQFQPPVVMFRHRFLRADDCERAFEADPELAHMVVQVKEAGERLPLLPLFPRTGEAAGHCNSYGGCPYLPFCQESNEWLWPQVFERGFTIRTPEDETSPSEGE